MSTIAVLYLVAVVAVAAADENVAVNVAGGFANLSYVLLYSNRQMECSDFVSDDAFGIAGTIAGDDLLGVLMKERLLSHVRLLLPAFAAAPLF